MSGKLLKRSNPCALMLGADDLQGKTFLDIGSGSGLFSLAARRLGARVMSFDFDPHSVSCTNRVRQNYFSNDSDWHVREGSVLRIVIFSRLCLKRILFTRGVSCVTREKCGRPLKTP